VAALIAHCVWLTQTRWLWGTRTYGSLRRPCYRFTLPTLPTSRAQSFPPEILSEIFLLVVQDQELHRKNLMLVCSRWREIVLLTPGIHSTLTIRRATQKDLVQEFINGRSSRLDMNIDMNDERDGNEFDPDNSHACIMAVAKAASRWRSIKLISPPPHAEYQDLHILQPLERPRASNDTLVRAWNIQRYNLGYTNTEYNLYVG